MAPQFQMTETVAMYLYVCVWVSECVCACVCVCGCVNVYFCVNFCKINVFLYECVFVFTHVCSVLANSMSYLLFFKIFMHLFKPRICSTMHRSSMDIVSKVGCFHDEHTDICHGTEINKLPHWVRNKTLKDKCPPDPLDYA